MDVRSVGIAGSPAAQKAVAKAQEAEGSPPTMGDTFDYTDGPNRPLEIALLPATDLILGNVVGDALQKGKKVLVQGEITDSGNPAYKETIDVRMELNTCSGELVTKGKYGPFECWTDPATIVSEKGAPTGAGMDFKITGYAGNKAAENPPDNEELIISPGFGEISLKGSVNGFAVDEKLSIDPFTASVNHSGNIAGAAFERRIAPSPDGKALIEGKFAELKEAGTISQDCEGNILIERSIGSFTVKEKVRFV
jgi:hypothetical protein